jgi:SAM-dependent methyltransferase
MTACRLCGHHKDQLILSGLKTDLDETYNLRRCRRCSFVTLHPLPDENILSKYYHSNYWQNNQGQRSKVLNSFLSLRVKPIIKELKALIPGKGHVLDWGTGDGFLVKLLNDSGLTAFGIDLYASASDDKRIFRTAIHNTPFPDNYFHAITGFHVLEHLRQPLESIRSALRLLKPRGIFIIEVPNIDSLQYRLFRSRWQPLEIPFHLNHFSPNSLQYNLSDNFNLKILKISYFSQRVSPSAFLLSIFPFFTPKIMRRKKGFYPTPIKLCYLLGQLVVYPLVLTEAALKRGAIMRLYLRKNE